MSSLSTIMLACIAAFGVILLLSTPVIFREMQLARMLDRQLAVLRREAMRAVPGSGAAASGTALLSLRLLGPTFLRSLSMLVPIGAREREKLTRTLRLAGFARQDALSFFLSCKFACGLAGAGLAVLVSPLLGPMIAFLPQGILVAFAGAAGLVIGGIVPEYVMRALVNRRRRKMTNALADALDLMVMCLESGLTFERALATVAEELTPIESNLAGEFRILEAELRLGSDRRSVLQDYYERTDVEGLRDFAMSLIQGDRYGTPLTQSMKNIAAGERLQRTARIDTWAARLPVLMTLPMLLLVVPGTMLLIGGPAFMGAMDALGTLGRVGGGSGGE